MKFEDGQEPYIVAEIGANHNGDVELAKRHIDTAKEIGCDAAKFQSWDVTLFSQKVYDENVFLHDDYRDRTDYTLKEIVEEFALTEEQLGGLAAYCGEIGIDYASTPFEPEQVSPLVEFGAPFVKIASMDVTNDRLLRRAAETGLPVVLSTGMAELGEIEKGVAILEKSGCRNMVVLHCVALYPTPLEYANLRNIDTLRQAFGHPVGLSDHSPGIEISLAAVALGAIVIEKHFTLDKAMFGWDHHMSMAPDEMGTLVRGAANIHQAMGSPRRVVSEREIKQRTGFRRSLVAARDIKSGQTILDEDITYRRPGTGLDPSLAPVVIGMVANRDIPYDTVIAFGDLQAAAT